MKHEKKIGTLATLLITVVLVLAGWLRAGHVFGDPRLIVWFFDVGQGDAIFIETPSGKQILVDGGPGDVVLDKLSAVMPFWDRSIDDIILTHPHADHLDGLVSVMDRFQIEHLYWTGVDYFSTLSPAFHQALLQLSDVQEVVKPATLDFGDGARLQFLYPTSSLAGDKMDDLNASSIVSLLTYGETSVLLTGDITADHESEIASALTTPIDVLKVAHHGSAYSSTNIFLQSADPRYAVISCGLSNDYGHPAPSTIQRLRSLGAEIFRTDLQSDIRLVSDGEEPMLAVVPL